MSHDHFTKQCSKDRPLFPPAASPEVGRFNLLSMLTLGVDAAIGLALKHARPEDILVAVFDPTDPNGADLARMMKTTEADLADAQARMAPHGLPPIIVGAVNLPSALDWIEERSPEFRAAAIYHRKPGQAAVLVIAFGSVSLWSRSVPEFRAD